MLGSDNIKDLDLKENSDFLVVIKRQQIDLMIIRLEELNQFDKKILFYLKNAKLLLNDNNSDLAVQTLQKILYDKKVSLERQKLHSQIIEEAKNFGVNLIAQEQEMMCKLPI